MVMMRRDDGAGVVVDVGLPLRRMRMVRGVLCLTKCPTHRAWCRATSTSTLDTLDEIGSLRFPKYEKHWSSATASSWCAAVDHRGLEAHCA